ncbi:MAG: glutamate mutase L [Planctomycetota bacterium]|nr:glutamate mutase L [Planctomycetota bacterium]
MDVILATDCGSTTTKAILIERKGDEYRQTYRGEAPTTVEAPFEDVTKGVLNAIGELEDLCGRKMIENGRIITPAEGNRGVDVYVSTSSAGGGLQMMVMGAVKIMTAESAERAALGAGAIVMDVLASNDMRLPYQKIERIRQLRPDMILLSGGTDGGTVKHVVEMAEYVRAARPRARLGTTFKLPVIYAGNKDARERIREMLSDVVELTITENIRPTLEEENLQPSRMKIQELFLEHVMAHAPGYKKLMEWTDAPIMPTPAAVGLIMQKIAKKEGINLLGVDIGGATTDVFSVFDGVFNRTVSANLGMSYSVSNVLAEAGMENIARWIPFEVDEQDIANRVKNKMIRPTTLPQTLEDLKIEQAIAREALRLAFEQHKLLAVGLKGVQQERTISDAFEQTRTGASLIRMEALDLIVGSGGILSHAPRRVQSLLMMIDSYEPVGVTRLAVDSIFMMPHLGVLSTINEKAATDVFVKDCMIELGTCVSLVNSGKAKGDCLRYVLTMPDGSKIERGLAYGEMALHPLGVGEKAKIFVEPSRGFDVGAGKGRSLTAEVRGGVVGVVIDARGRPLKLPQDKKERIEALKRWHRALDVYPE